MINKKIVFNLTPISYSRFLENYRQNSLGQAIQSFPELDFFKQPMPEDLHQIYASKRKESFLYQLIFYSLGLLFAVLAAIIHIKTANWKFDFYLGNSDLIKTSFFLFCLLLSAGAIAIGYLTRPEKEAIYTLVYKVKRHLNKLYRDRRRTIRPFFFFVTASKEEIEISFQSIYYQAIHKIEDHHANTLQLLERIELTKNLHWKAKERLFNQAIWELHEALNNTMHVFQQNTMQIN
jgi:hypothetical protein